jgi:hypothetical protein
VNDTKVELDAGNCPAAGGAGWVDDKCLMNADEVIVFTQDQCNGDGLFWVSSSGTCMDAAEGGSMVLVSAVTCAAATGVAWVDNGCYTNDQLADVADITDLNCGAVGGFWTGTLGCLVDNLTTRSYEESCNAIDTHTWDAGTETCLLLVDDPVTIEVTVVAPANGAATIDVGGTIDLTVSAGLIGVGADDIGNVVGFGFTYQWYECDNAACDNPGDRTAISADADAATYIVPATATIVEGTLWFRVVVNVTANDITEVEGIEAEWSTVFAITVEREGVFSIIVINAEPEGQLVTVGEAGATVALTVDAEITNNTGGAFTIAYQWFRCTPDFDENSCFNNKDFDPIENATDATFNAPIDAVGTVFYYVEVSDEDGELQLENSEIVWVKVIEEGELAIVSVSGHTAQPHAYDGTSFSFVDFGITAEEAKNDGVSLVVVTTLDDEEEIDLGFTWSFCILDETAGMYCLDFDSDYVDIPETGFTVNGNTLEIDADVLEPGNHEYMFKFTIVTDEDVPQEVFGLALIYVEEPVGILEIARETPADVVVEEVAVVAPVRAAAPKFVVGPSPVALGGSVNFFWQNTNGVLRVFDATGNFVREVSVANGWDLTDARGRLVAEGTYVVRGVLTANDGSRVRVSVPVTVVR